MRWYLYLSPGLVNAIKKEKILKIGRFATAFTNLRAFGGDCMGGEWGVGCESLKLKSLLSEVSDEGIFG